MTTIQTDQFLEEGVVLGEKDPKLPFDPILDEVSTTRSTKFVLLTEKDNPIMWDFYKLQEAAFWTMEEIKMDVDRLQFPKLDKREQDFIKNVLAFFACADGIVCKNILLNIQTRCKQNSVEKYYGFQNAIEGIHQETYTMLIEELIQDKKEQELLLTAIDRDEAMQEKIDWIIRWMESKDATFGEILVAFCCCEGIFFSSSFASIFWLKCVRRMKLPGLFFSNQKIIVDEGLHTRAGAALYNQLQPHNKCTKDKIMKIVKEAVEVEKVFVRGALRLPLIGMDAESMSQYVEFVADGLLYLLECPKAYNTRNPFDFMDAISLQGKTNFFEDSVGEYAKASISHTREEREFKLDADF